MSRSIGAPPTLDGRATCFDRLLNDRVDPDRFRAANIITSIASFVVLDAWQLVDAADYERAIRPQLTNQFASAGFNAERDIAGIILNRWGHARLVQPPGWYYGVGSSL